MSMGLIPWDKIIIYAEWVGLSKENSVFFYEAIKMIDRAYLKWTDENKKKND